MLQLNLEIFWFCLGLLTGLVLNNRERVSVSDDVFHIERLLGGMDLSHKRGEGKRKMKISIRS